jgi:hypothetical protein
MMSRRRRPAACYAADAGLGLVFGALVGALFLSVLLVITVWSVEPVLGALVVSALPAATFAVRPLHARLPARTAAIGGALLLAGGLVALALLPRISELLVAVAPSPSAGRGSSPRTGSYRGRPRSEGGGDAERVDHVGARHVGLVLALALVRRCLGDARGSDDKALLAGAQVVLEGDIPLQQKVPIAFDLREKLEEAKRARCRSRRAVRQARAPR